MNLRQYLPTVQERGRYTGPFSTFAEYHAFGIGFLLALGGSLEAGITYGLGSGSGKTRRSGHWRDFAQETAYGGLGAGVAVAVKALGLYP